MRQIDYICKHMAILGGKVGYNMWRSSCRSVNLTIFDDPRRIVLIIWTSGWWHRCSYFTNLLLFSIEFRNDITFIDMDNA